MKTIKLIYTGQRTYRSYDAEMKASIVALPGSAHDLSIPKADQLLRDFPKDWQVAPAGPAAPHVQEEAANAPPPATVVEPPAAAPAAPNAPPPAPAADAEKPKPKKKGGRR